MDLTKSFSYTLLDVARIVSYRVGNLKPHIETLSLQNADIVTQRFLQSYDDVIREIIRTKKPGWALREAFLAPAARSSITATVSNGDTTVTCNTGTVSDNHAGGIMYVYQLNDAARNLLLRIESITDSTHFELVDPFYWPALSSDGAYVVCDRLELPSDFMGLVGAYGYGRSLTFKTPQELSMIRSRLHSQDLPYSTPGPQYCTITRSTLSASTDQTFSYYLELYKAPLSANGLHVVYVSDFATAVDNQTSPDSVVVQIPEHAVDVLIDGIVADFVSTDDPNRREAKQIWRDTVLGDYVTEVDDAFCEDVSFIDQVS
jgi:hypothetical protein